MSSFFTVFGGLAIFIYSMQLMGEGLRGVAGQRLRSILHLFAKNRFVAILTGTVVTSLIQSSGATTVM
ncbi:MAG: Na/Pi cotransporter family protein, partial [Victivallales bacterium]|nr:Na/Pi cotransporter family protein [Victivallales bacterium]